jgi:hypothetical protein
MPITLDKIAEASKTYFIHELNAEPEKEASKQIQTRLCDLGLLDPSFSGSVLTAFGPGEKADGVIGLNTRNALFVFCKIAKIDYQDGLVSPQLAKALINAEADQLLPIQVKSRLFDSKQTKLAKKLVRYMQSKGYWIARSAEMINLIYSEGMDLNGQANTDQPNHWNDRRMAFRIKANGRPEMVFNYEATTEPGTYYVMNPLNTQGAARIAFGQYKAWVDGKHRGTQPALVQRGPIKLHRDLDKNGKRSKTDPIDIGDSFGINQHSTSDDYNSELIDRYSAGCLVGRNYQEHLKFLARVRKDVRYAMNKSYMFVTAVIAGDEFEKFK